MRTHLKIVLVVSLGLALGLAAAPTVSAEGDFTIGELFAKCHAAENSTDNEFCYGFVFGASELMHMNGNSTDANNNPVPDNGMSMCYDEPVRAGAMVQAFMNWAERNPKYWVKPAVLGVERALRDTWPCK